MDRKLRKRVLKYSFATFTGVVALGWLTILASWLYVDQFGPVYKYPAPEQITVISGDSMQERDIRFPNYIPRGVPYLGEEKTMSIKPLFNEGDVIELLSYQVDRPGMVLLDLASQDKPSVGFIFTFDKPLNSEDIAKSRLKMRITKVRSAEAQNFDMKVTLINPDGKETTTNLGRIVRVLEEYDATLVQ